MALKDKLNQLKTVALGFTLAAMFTNCTNKHQEEPSFQDMLTIKTVKDVDIYGNEVHLHKVSVPIYKDKNMKDEGYMQLLWGFDSNREVSVKRAGAKTHPEEYELPNGDTFVVEVYDDGVLKANNSMILINRKIYVVGDSKHYQENLNRRAAELQERANAAKRRRLEQIRAEERANAVKRKKNAAQEVVGDTLVVEGDSLNVNNVNVNNVNDSIKNNDHKQNNDLKHYGDSLPLDTMKYMKNKERE